MYDAPRLHAALNDLPAALLLVAVLFDLASAALRRESLRWAGRWTLWAGVVGGWAAVVAGELAEDSIEHGAAIHGLMERHQTLALVTMGVFTVVLLWKLYRRFTAPPNEELVLRGLGVLGLAGLVWTAAVGGRLMFEHAAGIPNATLQAELKNRQEAHEHEPGEARDSARPHLDPPGTPPHKH